jgi:hypothetical protein
MLLEIMTIEPVCKLALCYKLDKLTASGRFVFSDHSMSQQSSASHRTQTAFLRPEARKRSSWLDIS